MIKCPTCGNDAPDSARSCVVCSTPLPRPTVATAVLTPPFPVRQTTPDAETLAGPAFVNPLSTGGAGVTNLVPGQTFGQRYQVISLLGVGGMGAVYHVWDSELALSLALKVIKPDPDPIATQELERRFKRELVLARQVTHTNVIRIHDLGEIDGIKYITMPFVHGTDLAQLLAKEGKLPVQRALGFARQVVSGLRAAHEVGIVHRDLKPANILIDDSEKAVLTDFGIARSTDAGTFATAAGAIIGTLAYMAPEQATGKPVDQRADIYAFGLIFSEMLIGKRGSSGGDTALALLIERASHAPPRMRTVDPTIPEGLDAVVARCVKPDPAERYQSTRELEAALDLLDANGNERTAPAAAATTIIPKSRSQLLPVSLAIALGLAVGLGGWLYFKPQPTAAPDAVAQHAPVSVLIADFDNQANDPVFTGALEQALNIGIEGASFVTSYSRTTAQQLAQRLNQGSTLNLAAARLVAEREGINYVLTGTIAPAGSGYELTVKALDPASGAQRADVKQAVASKAGVLAGITTVASRLRDALGDKTPESARSNQETVTARSIEALHSYSLAQDLSSTGRWEESIEHYQQAIKMDDKLGRAYSGWGTALHNLGRREESKEVWSKALQLMDSMTEREKYRTLGAYFLGPGQSYKEAIENYTKLVSAYPADRAGENNLALAYFQVLDLPQAIAHGRRAVDIYPRDTRARNNVALYLMYAGDFKAAAEEANKVLADNPSQVKAYLPLAAAAVAAKDFAGARDAYGRMAKVGAAGASSLSAYGLADLAMYEGKWQEAEQMLVAGIAEDEKSNNKEARAAKHIALAEVRLAQGQNTQALAAVKEALAVREDQTLVPGAFVSARAGRAADAKAIADELSKQFQPRSRAYGAIVQADILRGQSRLVDAMDALGPAQKLADVWLGRYVLGVINVEAGRYAAALGEFNQCEKRRGEASAIFLDDMPSFRYLVPLRYWTARAQEGLGNTSAAADNYRAFLALRTAEVRDPLVLDARKRMAALGK